MKKHRIRLSRFQARYLLSDVLPFELPASVSNQGIYLFLKKEGISFNYDGKNIKCCHSNSSFSIDVILDLLFIDPGKTITRPYRYDVFARNDKDRVISVIHPSCQIALMAFMERFHENIIYQCSIGKFSLRSPSRLASIRFYRDYSHGLIGIGERGNSDRIEEFGREYETLKSYFVYKNVANIYLFYESREYHKLEKRFRYLARVDISNCFDSIYTHSISWAVNGKELVKANLSKTKAKVLSMPDEFDSLMQKANYAETNGIPIGPEVSRVFSEVILERIDLDVEICLRKDGLYSGLQYDIRRYVDDYFIFYDSAETYNKIKKTLIRSLALYNLSLNDSKEVQDQILPFITPQSVVKKGIRKHFQQHKDGCVLEKKDNIQHYHMTTFMAEDEIEQYKVFLANVDASSIANYYLTQLEILVQSVAKKWLDFVFKFSRSCDTSQIKPILESGVRIENFFKNVIDLVFYVLFASLPVNAYIITSRIFMLILRTLNLQKSIKCEDEEGNTHPMHISSDEICREMMLGIQQHLKRNIDINALAINQLILVNLAAEIGHGFFLDRKLFSSILGKEPDYLKLVVIMRYIRDQKQYEELRTIIIDKAKKIVGIHHSRVSADQTMLTFDMLACPYVGLNDKIDILNLYVKLNDINEKLAKSSILGKEQEIISYIQKNRVSFTNWKNATLATELELKRGESVY